MATSLDRYFQQTSREAVLTPLSVANTGSEMIGQAVQQLGATINGIAERDEQFWVQKQMADLDGRTRSLWDTSINNAVDGADGFEQSYLTALDADYETMRQAAPSPRALRMLESQLLTHRTNQAALANGFATEEKYQYRADTIRTDADNLSQELMRSPAVPAWSPQGFLTPPGLPAGSTPATAEGYFSTGIDRANDGFVLPNNISEWNSRYYAPRDFADGVNMSDRSGDVMVSRRVVANLDWVTDQFGYGKLQINSGYRSPESNVARADSGPHGPHTKGESIDVQVRELPQSEKNRLYSLFKATGANAFGFGEGVLHVEWREGQGNGRNGDHEWTYGGTAKYDQVAVAGPNASTSAAATSGQWGSPNQYPYLNAVTMTAVSETGTTDLATASLSVAPEGDGTVSYGPIGLNSAGMMPTFVREHGEQFGLTAAAGTPEFSAQWEAAVRADPAGMVNAQLAFHEKHIVQPAQGAIVRAGATAVANDPRALAFASDLLVQYGPAGAKKHLAAGAGARDVSSFINAITESTRSTLDADFATALGNDPSIRNGLTSRIDQRARDAMAMGTGMGTAITGNVPAWDGPVPNIEDVPMFSSRMQRIDEMVDTMGGTPDQRRDLKAELRGDVVRTWLSSVAQVNPSAAMAALMSGRYDNDLSAADSASLMGVSQNSYRNIETEIRQAQKDLMDTLKVEAQTALADEVVSIAQTGKGLGRLTEAHMAVLTPQQKETLTTARFQYDISEEIASAKNAELPAILERLRPEGEGFAVEAERYQFAQEAITAHLAAQSADPAAFVLSTYPQLANRWQAAILDGDSNAIASTIQAMLATQRDIGIPVPALLPSNFASSIAGDFNNPERTEQERIDSVMGTLAMTNSPEQKRIIFDQLVKEGVPEQVEAAIEADMRGDKGASRRLFQAAMLDPSKLPGKISEQTASISEEVQAQLFSAGQVGDIYYGLTDGDTANFAMAERDGSLITKAVQMRLVQGDDLATAVAKVGRDMFGDVQVVSGYHGVNTQILLPTGADPLPVLDGLAALQPVVRAAIPRQPAADAQIDAGSLAVINAGMSNYADMVIAEGYFRSADGGYVFIDPFIGVAVKAADGKPLIFSDDQVATASNVARNERSEAAGRAPAPETLTMQERQALENEPSSGGLF